MKKLKITRTATVVLFFLCLLNSASAKDKTTLIDRINSADSIPVYIVHGSVKPAQYNPQSGRIPLTKNESSLTKVTAMIPSQVDSLQPDIVSILNTQFNTTKFYAVITGSEEVVKNDILAKQIDFFIIAEFTSDYNFIYSKGVYRDANQRLNAIMDVWLRCQVQFMQLTENKDDLDRIKSTIGGGRKEFKLDDYTYNANVLMKKQSPLSVIPMLRDRLQEKLSSFAENEKKKHDKIVSKRK